MRYAFVECGDCLYPPAVPSRGSEKSAGLDVCAYLPTGENVVIPAGGRSIIPTGLIFEIPDGCYGRIAPRSGLAAKHGIDVLAGVVDADYRGEVRVILQNFGVDDFIVSPGDRIAQIIIEPYIHVDLEYTPSLELSDTARSDGGFGSTGTR